MSFTSHLMYENKRLEIENNELSLWLEQKKEELSRTLKEVADCLSNEMTTLTDMSTLVDKLKKTEKQRNIAMHTVTCLRNDCSSEEGRLALASYDKMVEELKK